MPLAMPIVWSERCRLHDPSAEIWVGVRTAATEVAARIDAIKKELVADGARIVPAVEHPEADLIAVHDPSLVDYLAGVWGAWTAAGLPQDPGQDRVVPYVFAHVGLTTDAPASPASVWARPGLFTYDTMTLVGPGTWEAARAAVDCALTAVDVIAGGAPCAYACCRPPGHHACRSCFGGSCYLNNAAVAAAALLDRLGPPVAVIDVDAHHGNGTQQIFYERADVVVGSVHVDPAAGWFPHFLGFGHEEGSGPGVGANRNVVVPPGTGDSDWLRAVRELAEWARLREPTSVVVALGVDAAAADPESPLCVTADGLHESGKVLATLGKPTVFVQEGGYDVDTIGSLVRETLAGFEEGLE